MRGYILETVIGIDTGIFTVEAEYRLNLYVLYRIVPLWMTLDLE